MSGSGPTCNLRLITAGEATSRNGTQLLPAALNYFSPLPRSVFLSLSQLPHCLSLISLISLILSPSLSISISCSPPICLSIYFLISLSCSLSLPFCLPLLVLDTRWGTLWSGVSGYFYWVCSGSWKRLFTNRVMMRCAMSMSKSSNPSQTIVCINFCVILLHSLTFAGTE